MCDPTLLVTGGLAEQLGDPFGTKKRRDDQAKEDQQNKWAREDQVRSAQYAHEEKMAGIQSGGGNTNRSSLNAGGGGRATGTPKSTRGGGRSSPGSSISDRAY